MWPGQPMTAHWGVPDPAAVRGTAEEVQAAFEMRFCCWTAVSLFLCLPVASLDRLALKREIDKIGQQ